MQLTSQLAAMTCLYNDFQNMMELMQQINLLNTAPFLNIHEYIILKLVVNSFSNCIESIVFSNNSKREFTAIVHQIQVS